MAKRSSVCGPYRIMSVSPRSRKQSSRNVNRYPPRRITRRGYCFFRVYTVVCFCFCVLYVIVLKLLPVIHGLHLQLTSGSCSCCSPCVDLPGQNTIAT